MGIPVFVRLCVLFLCVQAQQFPLQQRLQPVQQQDTIRAPIFFKYRPQQQQQQSQLLADDFANASGAVQVPQRQQQQQQPAPLKPTPLKQPTAAIVASKVVVVGGGDQGGFQVGDKIQVVDPDKTDKGAVETGVNVTSGVYVKTSGVQKPCKKHSDCYNMREPDDWCPLNPKDQYLDKGCHCNYATGNCAIERVANGTIHEFTDCANESTSACSGAKG